MQQLEADKRAADAAREAGTPRPPAGSSAARLSTSRASPSRARPTRARARFSGPSRRAQRRAPRGVRRARVRHGRGHGRDGPRGRGTGSRVGPDRRGGAAGELDAEADEFSAPSDPDGAALEGEARAARARRDRGIGGLVRTDSAGVPPAQVPFRDVCASFLTRATSSANIRARARRTGSSRAAALVGARGCRRPRVAVLHGRGPGPW